MSNTIAVIFSRAFVAVYVILGYLRHYAARVSLPSALTGALIVMLIAGFSLNMYMTPKPSGNDALARGLDLKNAGRFNAAHDAFEEAYEIFKVENYGRGQYVALRNLGDMDLVRSNPTEALYHFDLALRLAQQYNAIDEQIYLFIKHADIKLKLNRFDASRAHLYDALKISQETGQYDKVGMLFTRVGNLERDIGNDRRARFSYRNAAQNYAEHRNTKGEAALQWNIAVLESNLENYDAALAGFIGARELYRSDNDTLGEATVITHMARLEKKLGSQQQAAAYYNEAVTLYSSIGKNEEVSAIRNETADLQL